MVFDPNSFNINNFSNPLKHEILTVNSLQQVKDFVMNKGDSYLLLDPNSDVLYIKEMDSIGKVKISKYRLEDCSDELLEESVITMRKKDYDNILKRLEQLEGKNEASKSKQPEFNFASDAAQERN